MPKSIAPAMHTAPYPGFQAFSLELIARWTWRVSLFLVTALVLLLAWLVGFGEVYKPGSRIGYNLGLVGSLMMLTLLLYPLRKRMPSLDRLGSMQAWFRYHMVLGIVGPLLVLFHSTFQTKSMNGRVAFYAMILVAVSGVVGRFVYRQVHIGLYGRELTLADAEEELNASSQSIDSAFALEPEILLRLTAFRNTAFAELQGFPRRAWRFCTLRLQGRVLAHSIRGAVAEASEKNGRRHNWSGQQTELGYTLTTLQVKRYIDSVCKTARYAQWQSIFSLWHLVHIPFLYLLIISAIFHVIAVHMY